MRGTILLISVAYVTANMIGFPLVIVPHIGWGLSTVMLVINAAILLSVIKKL